jgi:hypothetical protein
MVGEDKTQLIRRRSAAAGAVFCTAVAFVLLAVPVAAAQQPSAPAPAVPQQVAPQQSSPQKGQPSGELPPAPMADRQPGFLDTLGHFIADSVAAVKAGMGSARDTFDGLGDQAGGAAKGAADAATSVAKGAADVATGVSDAAADAAKGAAEGVVRMPATRVVNGRERCTLAPNGAPDCRLAANELCKANGFAQGNSVDMQSAEKCPARVYISGRQSNSDCGMEHFVTRAMCQ